MNWGWGFARVDVLPLFYVFTYVLFCDVVLYLVFDVTCNNRIVICPLPILRVSWRIPYQKMPRLPRIAKKQCKNASANSFPSSRPRPVISAFRRSARPSMVMICSGPCQRWDLTNTSNRSNSTWASTGKPCEGTNQKNIREVEELVVVQQRLPTVMPCRQRRIQ